MQKIPEPEIDKLYPKGCGGKIGILSYKLQARGESCAGRVRFVFILFCCFFETGFHFVDLAVYKLQTVGSCCF